MNYTSITLGELLSSENETIKRNAVSILKVLQKVTLYTYYCSNCGEKCNNYHGYHKQNKSEIVFCEQCLANSN